MALRKRGIMKFQMVGFQPEFIHNLRQQHKEQEIIPKPTFDEQQLEYLKQAICESMEFHKEVNIKHYSKTKSEYLKGFIHYFDEKKLKLKIVSSSNQNHTIHCSDIFDIEY